MNPIDYLRNEIKSYFSESSELLLSSVYAQNRQFNFYFKIIDNCPFLLYLNWDGDYDRFTLKCLEFASPETLNRLMAAYPEKGAGAFNEGKPKVTVSFICYGENKLSVIDIKGLSHTDVHSGDISGVKLMAFVDPEWGV